MPNARAGRRSPAAGRPLHARGIPTVLLTPPATGTASLLHAGQPAELGCRVVTCRYASTDGPKSGDRPEARFQVTCNHEGKPLRGLARREIRRADIDSVCARLRVHQPNNLHVVSIID